MDNSRTKAHRARPVENFFTARLAYSLEPFSTEVVYPMKGDHFRITVSIKSADVPKLTTELMSQNYHH